MISVAGLGGALFDAPVFAESATASTGADTPNSADFEEIVVTARRRSENVERVPTVIAAFDSQELQKREINTEADLQRSVAGLTLRETQNTNNINYSIRGETVDAFSSSHPGVLAYVNEFQTNALGASSFYDLQSVQVLKGPQGTLFGRNTTGGAVLYTTAKPTDVLGGEISAVAGNYDRKEVSGYLNIPLIGDQLIVRLAGRVTRQNGYETNLTKGGDAGPSDLGGNDTQAGRITLLYRPNDSFENETVAEFVNVNTETGGAVIYSLNSPASGLVAPAATLYNPSFPLFGAYVAANPQAYAAGITAFLALQQARGPYTVNLNSPSFFKENSPSATNTTTYTISPDLVVKNIAGFSAPSNHYSTDPDGTPYTLYNLGPFGATIGTYTQDKQYSEELQLQGKAFDKALSYIVGGYYSYERSEVYLPQDFFALPPVIPAATSDDDLLQTFASEAIFSQGTYDLAPLTGVQGLSATLGGRYTWEKVISKQLPLSIHYGGPELDKLFDKPSWTAGVEYQATSSLLLYLTQRGSWRSGGFNGYKAAVPGLASVGGSEFLPETTRDVELGAKFDGHILGRPFRLNLAAYNQWSYNVQRVVYANVDGSPTAVTASVPAAITTGGEIDGQYSPIDWLTVGLNTAYTEARFTKNTLTFFGATTAFGPYPDTPRWTGDVFAEVHLPVPSNLGTVDVRADTYHQSSFYFSSTASTITPGTELPSYGLTNFRVNWGHINQSKVSADLFMTNAFNKVYYTGGLAVGATFGLNTAIPGRPRMYGGEVHYEF